MPELFTARTVVQIPIDQSVAGSNDLVAAPGAGLKIYVVTIMISQATGGTVQFTEGTGPVALTGNIPLSANGGFMHSDQFPVLQTNTANAKLSIVTTGGAADGWLRYFIAG